jgi:hypothetical protein
MAGFAFVFLQRTLEETTRNTEDQLTDQLSQQGQKYIIDNQNDASETIFIRHIGQSTGTNETVFIYINDAQVTCTWPAGANVWVPQTVKTCVVASGFTCNGDTEIELSAPGGRNGVRCLSLKVPGITRLVKKTIVV